MKNSNNSNTTDNTTRYNRYEQDTTDIKLIRPNNYAVRLPIVKNPTDIHLPRLSRQGWHGSTVREYLDYKFVKVERTTQHLIFYLKKRIVKVAYGLKDWETIEKEIKQILIDAVFQFLQEYPQFELDLTKITLIRSEIEVKDKQTRLIPKDVKLNDTVMKKVYPFGVEFKNPLFVKNYFKNRAIEDISPELIARIDALIKTTTDLAENINLHLKVMKQISDSMEALNSKLTKKSIWQQLKDLFK